MALHRIRRRTVLGAALAAPLAASLSLPRSASAAERLPLTVVNNTGRFGDDEILMHIVGSQLDTGTQCYVRPDGALTPVTPDLNGPDGFADLSMPISTALSLPNMSGRIYFSVGEKVRFRVVTDGNGNPALQYPAGWVSSDPSYGILHDCAEFTFAGSGMYCNTTMVDMLSIPLAIELVGAQTQTTGTLVPGGRSAIFAALAALPEFSGLVLEGDLRVIAPGHGINAGLFPAGYFDGYVNEVWQTYAGTDLVVDVGSGRYTGRVIGEQLVFDGDIAPFSRPSTKDVFFCDGALSAPNDGRTGPVAAVLGAGFNRTVLRDHADQPTADPARYYQTPVTNHYAKVMHEHTVDGRAYGFAFDDVLDHASYIQDTAPTSVTVTLTPML